MRIWKYELALTTDQVVLVPSGYRIVHIDVQHDRPCIWCMVDPSNRQVRLRIIFVGTGFEIPNDIDTCYIGTVLLNNQNLVLHAFQVCDETNSVR